MILVTGAAGFIGSHLTEALARDGHKVRALVHYNCQNRWGWLDALPEEVMANVEVLSADITDPFAVQAAVDGCEVVYHLAALIAIPYSYLAPSSFIETNIKGTMNVLMAARRSNVKRIVHTSTSEVYGSAQYVPIDERHPLVGQSPYSASKIAADKLAESFHLSFALPVATVRPFNTFGPRQSARAVIPTIASQALAGVPAIRLGSLTPVRDLTYVRDTVAGFRAVAASDAAIGQVTNIGRGEGVTIGELAKAILDICGSRAEIVTDDQRIRPEGSEVLRLICDNSKAKQILGWSPRYSLTDGLQETVLWLRENLGLYKPTIYNL
jgi:NAD dependent epimerase/dehydratase